MEEGRDWIVWSQEILEIQLVKGENGLGFSILDYQVKLQTYTSKGGGRVVYFPQSKFVIVPTKNAVIQYKLTMID